MLLIRHRVNTVAQLRQVPPDHGIEIDLRDCNGKVCLAHDPFQPGEPLEELLAVCRHRLVIFNVKSDGLEESVIAGAERYGIADYFFLDVANPTLVNLVRQGFRKVAVRYSEFEALEFALGFSGKVDWVWVDCFTHLPLTEETYRKLRGPFKICLVSPELQGHPRTMIQTFRAQLRNMPIDAVCTDYCQDWQSDE